MFKKDRFSIRKIKGVVGSVFLGSLLMAPSVVDAATYHYVNKEIISQEAKDLIQTGKPDRNEVVYGLVYQKDQLPQTGTEASVLTAFGYLSGDILKTLGLDTVLEETSAKPGEVTVVEVETPQSTTNQEQARTENQVVETEEAPKEEAPKTEESPKEEPKSEIKPTDDTLPKVEEGKEDSAEPAPVEEVGGEVESKPEEKVAVKPESQPSDKPTEEPKVEQVGEPVEPSEDEQAPTAPVEPEKQPEAPEEEKAVEETPKPEDKIKGIGTKEPVDKSELNNQIDKASSVSPTDYSTASYNDLGPVLETAKGVYASEPVKQPEVNSETNKLKTAIDALNVDKSELQEQLRVAEQKQQADYSAKTWREFKIAELQAKEINNPTTPLPKQSEIDAATKAIQNDPSKEYRLGQSMSARNVVPNGKSYITKEFTGKLLSSEGKQFAITELEHPLFNVITNATINNVNFENVEIERSGQDNIASLANTMKGSSVITNVKITGTLSGRNNVAGFVNNMNDGTRIENVAFFGKLHSTSGNGSHTGGIAGTNYRGIVRKAYVDATITGNKTRASLLVPKVDYGLTLDHLIGTKALLTESVVKGKIDVSNPVEVGAIASKTWPVGTVSNSVSYAKIIRGEELFGSNDVDDSDYASAHIKDLYAVEGYSSGNRSFRKSKTFTKLTKEQADAKVTTFNITADKLESDLSPLAKLNEEKAYSSIQDYNAEYNQAYKNLEKLIPFYNKDYIVYQGNKLNKEHHLNTKEVLSVTAMNNNEFITNLDEANKIIVHYADGTKDYFNLSSSSEGLSNVKEYTITDLGIKYTPNIVQKDNTTLVNDIKSILESVELQSQTMYQHLNRLGDYRVNAIKDLYLEESFTDVKENLTNLITKLVQNEEHQLNDSPAARQMIRDKVEKNKAALLLGLTYLNRYYGVKFGDVNIKELMLFKPDFYGEKVSVLDRLIEIGSKENNIKGSRTFDAFGQVLAKYTKSGNLDAFLNYNRQLFTNIDNMNDWFIDATEDHVYIAERASEVEEIKNSKHRAFDNLKRSHLRNTILPLLNIDKAHLYLISNYNAIAFGSAERLGKKSLEDIKDIVNKAADGYRNYYDFWYRLASDNVKQRLLRDAVIPIWEGYNAPGGWVEKYGRYNTDKVYTPLREFFGPMDKYYNYNGTGAYAAIYPNSDDIRTDVKYVHLEMVGEYGISVYTHETTHVNDRAIYLGGFGHREGTDAEAYAQGMLQTPVTGSGFDEFGSLGINMVFKRKNDGNQWYITDPKTLKTREDINRYMKGYNDTLTLLDEIEAESVISQQNKDLNSAWFKKIDREYRDNNKLNQWDKIRNLSQEEKNELNIQSVNDLVDQQLMTNRNPGNGIYKPEAISYNDQSPYVGVRMMTGIYGGNTSKGAPGAVSFKHNAFRLWGYYGYENGFLGYASNKYKQQSKTDGESVLSDEYIIKKISNNTFNTIEEFKKAYFKEVKDKATKGLTTFEVNGSSVSSYDDLLTLFKEAVKKDAETLKQEANGNKTVSMNNTVKLKEAVYKKLLQQTDSFKTSIFK